MAWRIMFADREASRLAIQCDDHLSLVAVILTLSDAGDVRKQNGELEMIGMIMSSLRRGLGSRAGFLSRVMGRALRRVTVVAGASLWVIGLSVVPVAIQATANPAKADAATEAVLIVGAGVSDGQKLHPVNVIYSTAESPASKKPGWLDLPASGYTCKQGKIRAWCGLGSYYEVILYHDGKPEEVLDWEDVKVTVDPRA